VYEFLRYRVADAMSRDPLVLAPDTTVRDAERVFEDHDFNGVPVVRDGRVIGFLTKLDLLAAFAFVPETIVPPYETIMRKPIAEVMTREPLCVPPEMPLTRVLALMLQTRNKSFPVLDRGRLVGIVAREDILHAVSHASRDHVAGRADARCEASALQAGVVPRLAKPARQT
jgi:CBS domain-containing protein